MISIELDLSREGSVNGIVLEKGIQQRGIGEVVNANDIVAIQITFKDGAKHEPPDSVDAVDAELDRHLRVHLVSMNNCGRNRINGRCISAIRRKVTYFG